MINQVLEFIKTNWMWLSEVLTLLILIIILILKKKVNVIDTIKGFITQSLPTAINEAEKRYGSGHGQEKLVFVCDLLITYISEKYGLPEAQVIRLYHSFIYKSVESILSTPQKKKEVSYGKR